MSKFKIGDKVVCEYAATTWYTPGKVYDVVAHPEFNTPSVQGSDGLHDQLAYCMSQFSKLEPKDKLLEIVRKNHDELPPSTRVESDRIS